MNIGIIGLGVVGSAVKFGFEKIGHTVVPHDIKLDTNIESLLNTDIIYLCVPTPSNEDGSCDTSIVYSCIKELSMLSYNGAVVVKSTVAPGTTQKFINEFPSLRISFVPEFLRERCAIYDFIENNTLLVIGSNNAKDIELIKASHEGIIKDVVILTTTEAELLKYYSNVFNALRVIFANEMYEVSKAVGANYSKIKQAYLRYSGLQDIYLDVNDNFRGYAGVCLPKDVKAIAHLCREKNLDMKLFETIDNENRKFMKTSFKGMRL